jgi:hypothetical protein
MRTDHRSTQTLAPRTGSRRHSAVIAAATVFAVLGGVAQAIEGVTLAIESVGGTGWSASDLNLELALDSRGLRGHASIARLRFDAFDFAAHDVEIDCSALVLSGHEIVCSDGRVVATTDAYGPQQLVGSMRYDRATSDLDFAVSGLNVAGGVASVDAALHEAGWRGRIELKRSEVAQLAQLATQFGLDAGALFAVTSGIVDLEASGTGKADRIAVLEFDVTAAALTGANEAGTIATESLDFKAHGTVARVDAAWQYRIAFDAPGGQAYVEPVFLDLAAGTFAGDASGRYRDDGTLEFERFEVSHARSVQATGSATLRVGDSIALDALDAEFAEVSLPGAWQAYAQPFLLDTGLANLATDGRLSGRVRIRDGLPELADLTLEALTLDDGKGAFSIVDLSGELHWIAQESATDVEEEETPVESMPPSRLEFRGGSLFGLALGSSTLDFMLRGRGVRLLEPATLPVLDGAIDLEALRIRNLGTDKVAFLIGAEIRPISVAQLCQAFGWPEFGGKIAGTIKKLRMREGVVSLGTTLVAEVFDGQIRLSDLRLERPFDEWPRLYANVELDRLDLEQVTSSFSFGRITGLLGGRIDGLELFNWMPIAFDATLATPRGDRSKHRISQRAVENIGSLGGSGAGVTAALSSGFLQFFEDFNYDRLGISCRLRNEICQMGGVEPAEGRGYYLVKGKGLPRIDVIGNRTRVDWPRLVRQLIAITESEGPVVD